MSPLLLQCALCDRRQADGLLSRGYWGHLEIDSGATLRACPTCKQQSDWEDRLRVTVTSVTVTTTTIGDARAAAG